MHKSIAQSATSENLCIDFQIYALIEHIMVREGGHFSLKRGQFSLVKVVLGGQISLGNFVLGDIIFR